MSLNDKILEAHHNKNLSLLVELYQEAAKNVSKEEEENFFLVQAYTFALEVSHSKLYFYVANWSAEVLKNETS